MRTFLYTGTQLFRADDVAATFGRCDERVKSREVHIRLRMTGRDVAEYLVVGVAVFCKLPWDWVFWRSLDSTRHLTTLDAKQAFDEAFDERI